MSNFAIILAGGTGSRAGGPLPKQFQVFRGRRMIWWSVSAFHEFDPECHIILVVHPEYLARWEELFGAEERSLGIPLTKVAGGKSRIQSVKNGLDVLKGEPDGMVMIHDAARPYVTPSLIKRGMETARTGVGAVPAVALTDTIRRITPCGSEYVNREDYVAIQTPQVFMTKDIIKAYSAIENEEGLSDDASVAERDGIVIRTYKGDTANIKITNPEDLKIC